ncbi:MAG: chromosomal replication initiator protein DnaA [Chloroflexi bacterium]|nr:MAG: chromosomal replication initiator protein DnaA [Chloroflexota bacterium]MBL1194399.1 chromosomal replication initiator protein DnaA [Chloroflexota bacterium]NOH11687.1 chromosomal replication initiator protein DnaA [Chloroflexota bacterium]
MQANQAWQAVRGQLQMEMPKATFDTWVRDADFVAFEDGYFVIGVQNAYARDWLESRLTSTVSRLLTGVMNRTVETRFVVWQETPAQLEVAETATAETTPPPEDDTIPYPAENRTLNPRYSFETFVVGASNRLAHAASLAVAENPAKAYNPLFLYGGVGMGKTHLLHAIGNAIQATGTNVLYVSSEEFTNDLIHAIRTHTTQAFREKYRRIDVLLIDDIQFIAGKESTQEEFFHTFNTLHGQNKQLVISSDRSPKAMVTLEERLRSRFEWGLIADIQPPDLETRQAILQAKAERMGRAVPHEILEVIAQRMQSNIRELEGALNRILAHADLRGMPLSIELVESALADMIPQRRELQPQHVLDAVSDVFGVTVDRLLARDRSREIALPRQVAMFILREEAQISLPQIGEFLGGRDHTTVMYGCDKVSGLIEEDDRLRRQVVDIREQLYGQAQPAW